jgi:hypothetical protein
MVGTDIGPDPAAAKSPAGCGHDVVDSHVPTAPRHVGCRQALPGTSIASSDGSWGGLAGVAKTLASFLLFVTL